MSLLTTPTGRAPQRRRAATGSLAVLAGVCVVLGLAGCAGSGSAASLPGDFPEAVQLPAGTLAAAAQDAGSWTASVKLDGDATRQAAVEQLTDNGFAIIGQSGANLNDRVYSLANERYSVRLGVTTVDGIDVLNYTVAERHLDSSQ